MIAVITGDIIGSRTVSNHNKWLKPLKKVLSEYGKSPKTWEIFRGDSFQLEVSNPEDALLAAIRIKASIKQVKELDVRMGIGLGDKSFSSKRITQANGSAFIHSGEKFEALKKDKLTLGIMSSDSVFDAEMNTILRLGLIAMDHWTVSAAEFVMISLENKNLSQQEIGNILAITQSSVSERQARAHFSEVMEMETVYRSKIRTLF